MSGFLFVVLVFVLGQGGVPSYCDRVVHSFISVDRVSVVKIIDLQNRLLNQVVSFNT